MKGLLAKKDNVQSRTKEKDAVNNTDKSDGIPYLTKDIEEKCKSQKWPDVYKQDHLKENSGLFSATAIKKGSLVCNYGGELLTKSEGDKLAKDGTTRSMYLISFKNGLKDTEMYYDNFHHLSNFGRFINHSKIHANLRAVVFYWKDDNRPELMMKAITDIQPDQQLLFNYGGEFYTTRDCVQSCAQCSLEGLNQFNDTLEPDIRTDDELME